jgi:hypothetical protein
LQTHLLRRLAYSKAGQVRETQRIDGWGSSWLGAVLEFFFVGGLFEASEHQ